MHFSAMSADAFVRSLSYAMFIVIFAVVSFKALRDQTKPLLDASLLFGDLAILAVMFLAKTFAGLVVDGGLEIVVTALVLLLPYILIRLVGDCSDLPNWILRANEGSMALAVAGLIVLHTPRPDWLTLCLGLYFAVFSVFAAWSFLRASAQARGITQRRLRAISVGALFLTGVVWLVVTSRLFPGSVGAAPTLTVLCEAGCAIGFFLGVARPAPFQRAWQDPELRAFLERAAALPGMQDKRQLQAELERGACESLGAPVATIGFWNEASGCLDFDLGSVAKAYGIAPSATPRVRPGEGLIGRCFVLQQPLVSFGSVRIGWEDGDGPIRTNIKCALAGPVTTGMDRMGVLGIYGMQQFLFADEDLPLTSLLAKQAALILKSHNLIAKQTEIQARERAALLEEGFLACAAHELKTPLTRILGQAQLAQRRVERGPGLIPVKDNVDTIVRQARRMRSTVNQLLDVAWVEHGSLLGPQRLGNLSDLAREVCTERSDATHHCVVNSPQPVTVMCDPDRIVQVLENLVGNAVKYSPLGGEIEVRLWSDDGSAHVAVTDHGIGIDPGDMDQLFTPFYRASSATQRHLTGLGLGLFISKNIIEGHHGHIHVQSDPGERTTVEFDIPKGFASQ